MAARALHGLRRVPHLPPRCACDGLGRDRPDAPSQSPGLLRRCGCAALRPRRALEVAPRLPLRLDPVPGQSRSGMGRGSFPRVLSLRVPALPPGLQADGAHQLLQLPQLRGQRRKRPTGGRDLLAGHLHPGCPPDASILELTGAMLMLRSPLLVLATVAVCGLLDASPTLAADK